MYKYEKKSISALIIFIIMISCTYFSFNILLLNQNKIQALPKPSDSIPLLTDEDSIEDPRGQDVKQSHILELGRKITLNLIKPIDWNLKVFDFKVVSAQIPIDLDLTLGMSADA